MRAEPTPEVPLTARPRHVPMQLAELHRELEPGDSVSIRLTTIRHWDDDRLGDVIAGAGFEAVAPRCGDEMLVRRLLTLPDIVGPRMRILVCGLNPSIHAAEMGVGFGRAGNRFWPAALAAGIVSVDRDPDHALRQHGLGMTDIVKRATPRASELDGSEYAAGMQRLARLVRWLEPGGICMIGLAGWRAAVDRSATSGLQDRSVGGRPVYVMPSTSGLNAHSRLEDLTEHLTAASSALAGPALGS